MRWSAVLGLLLYTWEPPPHSDQVPDASPSARLTISVFADDPTGSRALNVRFGRGSSSLHPYYAVQRLSERSLGTHTVFAQGARIPPPIGPLRRHLSQLGLRPADVSRQLATVWPKAAAAAVMAEERWARADWNEEYERAVQAFVAEHGVHPTDGPKLTIVQQQEWIAMWPSLTFPSVRAAASELTTSSDPWVDDVAWAYAFAHAELEDQEQLALDLLASDPSPQLLGLAMTGLQSVRTPLTEATEEVLRRVAAERPEHAARLGVYGFEAAVIAGDIDRAASFLPMIEDGLGDMQSPWTVDELAEGVDQARGQLAARGRGSAESWRAGLIVLAHRCAEQAPNRATVRGAGVYDAGWRWRLTPEDDFTACFTGTEPPGPPPPEGQRVDLTIRIVPE